MTDFEEVLDSVNKLREAREVDSVMKLQILKLHSSAGGLPILVYEGDDDKIVYSRWIARVRPALKYDVFVCDGKNGVRKANRIISKDRTGLGDQIYFFVDRDFDDLSGFSTIKNVFMCDYYSIENYLVSEDILDSILRDEFPCHGRPEIRKSIVEIFKNTFNQFNSASRNINFRIFCARVLPIKQIGKTPSKYTAYCSIGIDTVTSKDVDLKEIVNIIREPTDNELSNLAVEFEKLDPASRYRGKFIYSFFKGWLETLYIEFSKRTVGIFGNIEAGGLRREEISLGAFASRSKLPFDFVKFIQDVS